jgi:hypothetical protein
MGFIAACFIIVTVAFFVGMIIAVIIVIITIAMFMHESSNVAVAVIVVVLWNMFLIPLH